MKAGTLKGWILGAIMRGNNADIYLYHVTDSQLIDSDGVQDGDSILRRFAFLT